MPGIAMMAAAGRPRINATVVAGAGTGSCSYQSPAVNCTGSKSWGLTITGGSGNYSYQWSLVANGGLCTLSNATSATCTVTRQGPDGSYSYQTQCVVTDNLLGVSDTAIGPAAFITCNNIT